MTTPTPTMLSHIGRLPIPQRIAGFALTSTLFILLLLGLAHHNFRGEILAPPPSSSASLRAQPSFPAADGGEDVAAAAASGGPPGGPSAALPEATDGPYYVFLQKFPLQNSFKRLFHTEVIVCPRSTFDDAAFLEMLDGKLATLAPGRFDQASAPREDVAEGEAAGGTQKFAEIDEAQWSARTEGGCVQLGYGGANCGMGCCGSPHKHENTHYALSSREAVIGNAMGDRKELYLYGISGSPDDAGISGMDAYKSVCHGHMNAIEMGKLPACVSDWKGRDYNPITNNCNTFTSAVLKCVYGLSDAKPHLGVSDMMNVKCPTETGEDGTQVEKCLIPKMDALFGVGDKDALSMD